MYLYALPIVFSECPHRFTWLLSIARLAVSSADSLSHFESWDLCKRLKHWPQNVNLQIWFPDHSRLKLFLNLQKAAILAKNRVG